jgi:hypothetical protein
MRVLQRQQRGRRIGGVSLRALESNNIIFIPVKEI